MNLVLEIRSIVENTANCTGKERMDASAVCTIMRHIANKLAENHSVILAPSAVGETPSRFDDRGKVPNIQYSFDGVYFFSCTKYSFFLNNLGW